MAPYVCFKSLNSESSREAVAVSGVCSGVPEANSGKITGNIIPKSQDALNSSVWSTGKGKPAAKPWVDNALDLVATICGGCF